MKPVRTEPREQFRNPECRGIQPFILDIDHRSTALAPKMVMFAQIAVETPLLSGGLQLLDYSRLGKLLQIPVDGSQTDLGKLHAQRRVQLIRGGMCFA